MPDELVRAGLSRSYEYRMLCEPIDIANWYAKAVPAGVANASKAHIATQRHPPASSARAPAGSSHALAWREVYRGPRYHQLAVLAEQLREATAATGRSFTLTCHSGGGRPLVLRCEPGKTSAGPTLGHVALFFYFGLHEGTDALSIKAALPQLTLPLARSLQLVCNLLHMLGCMAHGAAGGLQAWIALWLRRIP